MSIEISAEPTPNPNAIKFTANQPIVEGTGSLSVSKNQETDHPLAQKLLTIDGVASIFGINDFITVNKTPEADWDALMPQIEETFKAVY